MGKKAPASKDHGDHGVSAQLSQIKNKMVQSYVKFELALGCFTLLLYLNSFKSQFVFDDVVAVVENKVRSWLLFFILKYAIF
jgi:hypothetical protein